MIEPTDADIGRRVVYDPRPILPRAFGTLVGITGGWAGKWPQVQFDFAEPGNVLNVGAGDLHWADVGSTPKAEADHG